MTNMANQGNLALQQGNIRATQYQNLGSAANTGYNMLNKGGSFSNSAPWATMFANTQADPLTALMSVVG